MPPCRKNRVRFASALATNTSMERTGATWPDLLTSRRAVVYSWRSRTSINRAVLAGLLPVAGRVGGVGERVFRRSDIDAWLLGRSAPLLGCAGAARRPPGAPARERRAAGSRDAQ